MNRFTCRTHRSFVLLVMTSLCFTATAHAAAGSRAIVVDGQAAGPADVSISDADVFVDSNDATAVQLAGSAFGDDVERVTGRHAAVKRDAAALGKTAILIGTLGQSPVIDKLAADGKIATQTIAGQWESFGWFIVNDPLPNVHQALVIVGADRRGTAFGVFELSRRIGVSPWYFWADVPPTKHSQLRASGDVLIEASPKVKYRGIFLNDEDWGLRPWASKTFDPATGNIGPKTYARIFELMLRLRLNYIWPAMHPGSAEFTTFPGNAECADQWAIVTGSSHCEPMLRNNVYWPKSSGEWRYDTNTQAIHDYWKWSVDHRGDFESVWTLGIRGIHDSSMSGPKDPAKRVSMLQDIFADQRELIQQTVSKKFGPPAQCFVPYKEVLPLYNMGLKVPDDVTLVWPDDNFGYIRRLGTSDERARSGGSGVYYHLSYLGGPRSYIWTETNSPGLVWEELRKAYDNGSKALWIVNVGDSKPAEMVTDFYARLAWNPEAWAPDAQQRFLKDFSDSTFGSAGPQVSALQEEYYRIAARRKPEHIAPGFAASLSESDRKAMLKTYDQLLKDEHETAAAIAPKSRDAYFEMVGYSAQMLGATGKLYLGNAEDQQKWKTFIDDQTAYYNKQVAGGKWDRIIQNTMPDVTWPMSVGGKLKPSTQPAKIVPNDAGTWIEAAAFTKSTGEARSWKAVDGLGWSGHAITTLPATADAADGNSASAPTVEYAFNLTKATGDSPADGSITIAALPTMHLANNGKLRIAVSIDGAEPTTLDIPGGEASDEYAPARRGGVISNRVKITVPASSLAAGHHTLKITALDPGVVLDEIELPAGGTIGQ